MTALNDLERYMTVARDWANTHFPHFTRQISPSYTLDDFLDGIQIVLEPLLAVRGEEIDAVTELDSSRTIKINLGRILLKDEPEKIALLLHEMIEGYGYGSCLHRAMFGFRPEHEYAEFVEHHYRLERGLPRCPLALTETEFGIMQKVDAFYRAFPIKRRYLGDTLYQIIKKDPQIIVNEQLRDEILEKCVYDLE